MGRVRRLYALDNNKINNQGIISKVSLEEATLLERRRLMLPRTSLVIARHMVPYSREADRVEGIFEGAEETAKPRVDREVLNRGNRLPRPVPLQGL